MGVPFADADVDVLVHASLAWPLGLGNDRDPVDMLTKRAGRSSVLSFCAYREIFLRFRLNIVHQLSNKAYYRCGGGALQRVRTRTISSMLCRGIGHHAHKNLTDLLVVFIGDLSASWCVGHKGAASALPGPSSCLKLALHSSDA